MQHQLLVQDVSEQISRVVEGRSRSSDDDENDGYDSVGEEAITATTAQWVKTQSSKLDARKRQIRENLRQSHPDEFRGESLQHFRLTSSGMVSDSDSGAKAATVRRSLEDLKNCWERLSEQVDDKQSRLDRALNFQQLYQQAMGNISDWLDDVELRLFGFDKHTDLHLKDNETLLTEIRDLQAEIATMTRVSQQVMTDVSSENKALMQKTLKVTARELI